MIEVEEVKNWLRDGEDFDAASLIEQCEFSYNYIDLAFTRGDQHFEIYTLKIHAPRIILKDLPKYKTEIDKIEAAVKELNIADSDFYIEDIYWVPLRGKTESSPSDADGFRKIVMNITEITRRNIIDFLFIRGYPFYGSIDLIDFLKRIWDLSSLPSTDHRFTNAEGDIWQHMVNNNDWEEDYLLYSYFNLLGCEDEIFLKFLETCLHPVVLRDDEQVSETLSEFNKFLDPDGYRLEVSSQISGKSVYKAIRFRENKDFTPREYPYEVVLSFAGEDREYVERVAWYLKSKNVNVFYDKYEEATLWGKDLAEHLDKVYRGSARYCVMFISKNYANKVWTSHERKSALAKAIEEKEEYILPARFDDTEIPGIQPTIGYVDLIKKNPDQLGEMILQKLGV